MNHKLPDTRKPPAWSHPAVLLATCFWIGRIRPAPGTWGSAAAIPVIVALSYARLPLVLEVSLLVTVCCIGIPLCTIATRQLGGQKDPSSIVIDEFLAMPLVLLVVSPEQRTWPVILIAFLPCVSYTRLFYKHSHTHTSYKVYIHYSHQSHNQCKDKP